MTTSKGFVGLADDRVWIDIHVVPGARKTEICGLHGDRLKLKVGAPPTDGRANLEIEEFLASVLGLRKSEVSIASGASSRQKRVEISTKDRESVRARVLELVRTAE